MHRRTLSPRLALAMLCACNAGTRVGVDDGAGTALPGASDGVSRTEGDATGSDDGNEDDDESGGGARLDVAGDPECPLGDCRAECEPEFERTAFEDPIIKCSWTDTETGVWNTPTVVDLDGDGEAEILFTDRDSANLVAIRGSDCSVVFQRTETPLLGTGRPLAVADIDGDGDMEIFGANNNEVVAMDHRGRLIDSQRMDRAGLPAYQTASVGPPAIADLDGQSPAEIVFGGSALRLVSNRLEVFWQAPLLERQPVGGMSLIGDVDLDGQPEVLFQNSILDGRTGAIDAAAGPLPETLGQAAIAQIDPSTPEPEIVAVIGGTGLGVFSSLTGALLYSLPADGGGPPTVADFDGDGRPEVALATRDEYVLFDPGCAEVPVPEECEDYGVRWRKATTDGSSGFTGSTPFDFNGDGVVEVAYRDECWLRIYDGHDGTTLSAFPLTSYTLYENPVVADVDGDGHAELVVPSDNTNRLGADHCPAELGRPHPRTFTQGVFVLEDPEDRWVPARALWNQHSYHITNINEDGTVPTRERNNWDVWNNYRQNVGPNPDGKVPCRPVPVG